MPLTLEDIAHISGYSRSTVSRVINGDSKVSEQAREKVNEVILRYNFQPNMAARGLAAGRTGVLGVVIPVDVPVIFEDPFFALLLQGISSQCNTLNYSVMLWMAEPKYERGMISKILYNGLDDGVIVASSITDDPIVAALRKSKQPFILVGRHPIYEEISFVDMDNRTGAKQAVLHLLDQGCQRVATISGPFNMIAGYDRYQGYLDALRERDVTLIPELVEEGDFSDKGGYLAMQRLLLQEPDAVFAASDTMALAAIRAIHERELRIPEDIALVGFDDIPQASRSTPRLTTMRQPIPRLGAMAAETLIELIQNPGEGPRQLILPPTLIIRESSISNVERSTRVAA